MRLGCEWRHARKRWAENLVILRKTVVEIWLWAEPVKLEVETMEFCRSLPTEILGATGGVARLLGQIVPVSRVKIVSLSPPVEKLKSRS